MRDRGKCRKVEERDKKRKKTVGREEKMKQTVRK